jgi:hypothetical protein
VKWHATGSGGGNVSGPSAWTPGSVAFADSTTTLGQDNPHLFWDNVNHRLGVGMAAPGTALHVDGTISAVNQLTGSGLQSMRWAEPGAGGYIAIAPSIPALMFDLSQSTNIVKSGVQAIVQVRGTLPPTPIMNVQGMAVQIFTPPDNGGDCSGFFCEQTGGGNAASFFNYYLDRPGAALPDGDPNKFEAYPSNGNAIEAQSDGTKTTIFVGLKGAGTGVMAVQQGVGVGGGANASFQSFTGDTGRSFVAQPMSTVSKSPNHDQVLTVINYNATQQTVALDFDGNLNLLGNFATPGTGYFGGTFAVGGNVGIGTAAPNTRLTVSGPSAAFGYCHDVINTGNTAGDGGIMVKVGPSGADSSSNLIGFYDSGATVNIGRISRTGTNICQFFGTSDLRLKHNVVESDIGLETLMKLKVRDYDMGGERQHGFVAQELHQHYPAAVGVGGGDPALEPWGVDYGRLTPLLVRALQQLAAKIEGN